MGWISDLCIYNRCKNGRVRVLVVGLRIPKVFSTSNCLPLLEVGEKFKFVLGKEAGAELLSLHGVVLLEFKIEAFSALATS